mgnify:CR=1 FL=1
MATRQKKEPKTTEQRRQEYYERLQGQTRMAERIATNPIKKPVKKREQTVAQKAATLKRANETKLSDEQRFKNMKEAAVRAKAKRDELNRVTSAMSKEDYAKYLQNKRWAKNLVLNAKLLRMPSVEQRQNYINSLITKKMEASRKAKERYNSQPAKDKREAIAAQKKADKERGVIIQPDPNFVMPTPPAPMINPNGDIVNFVFGPPPPRNQNQIPPSQYQGFNPFPNLSPGGY